jgi:hypothetical protein
LDFLVEFDGYGGDGAGDGGSDLAGFVGVGFGVGLHFGFEFAIADGDFAGLAVQLEEDRPRAVLVGFADG